MYKTEDLISGETLFVTLPEIYLELKTLLDDPDHALADVGRLLGKDPGITARLLRLANSAFFGGATRIDTVAKAVNRLGTHQVHDLVLATTVADAFAGKASDAVDVHEFWNNSVRCAVIARKIAAHNAVPDAERLFLAGLLRDIGHFILLEKVPDLAAEARRISQQQGELLFDVEQRKIGCDFAQVGADLMKLWKLPVGLEMTVRHHTRPSRAEKFGLEAAILHLAGLVVETSRWDSGSDDWDRVADPAAWNLTDMTPIALAELVQDLDGEVNEVLQSILPKKRKVS